MLRAILLATAVLVFSGGPSRSAPREYEARLPQEIIGMKLVRLKVQENELIAYYGQKIGRATLKIFPSPGAEPGSVSAASPRARGPTPAAQRALIQAVDHNLATGTKAVGPDYETGLVRIAAVKVDDGAFICATVERRSGASRPEKTRISLLDRICATQNGPDVITLFITSPHRGRQAREALSRAQLGFTGILFNVLLEDK